MAVDLMMVRNGALSRHNFTVRKDNIIMFKLKAQWSLHDHRILRDPAGNPIVTLRQKNMSMHGIWNVFRGESSEKEDLLFTAKTSSWLQPFKINIKMDVFLANNTTQETPDFKMDGSSSERSGTIYARDGTILAKCVPVGMKDKFIVTIYTNVEHASIMVALISILLDNIDASDGSELRPLLGMLNNGNEGLVSASR